MVRITKVYTRQGDKGATRLAGGQEVSKTSARIEAYGTVDELNACMGLVAESIRERPALTALLTQVQRIQNELFDLGSQFAVLPEDRREDSPVITPLMVTRLEEEMDAMNATLPALTSFILPSGGETSARLHRPHGVPPGGATGPADRRRLSSRQHRGPLPQSPQRLALCGRSGRGPKRGPPRDPVATRGESLNPEWGKSVSSLRSNRRWLQ